MPLTFQDYKSDVLSKFHLPKSPIVGLRGRLVKENELLA